MLKKCNVCGLYKSLDKFVKDKSKKDGRRNQCKSCLNLRKRKTPIMPEPQSGFKYCARCKEEKQLSDFNVRTVKGKKRTYSYCKVCERNYNNNRYEHVCLCCGLDYKSGEKNSTYCFKCHCLMMSDSNYNPTQVIYIDWSGPKNPMYGKQRFGKENPNYNTNKTDEEREKERLVEGYGIWRKNVFERDNYTCQHCGDNRGGNLKAHHLDSWDWCREKRLEVDNGITLCDLCHKQFHDEYGYGKNTIQQFITFMSKRSHSN